VEGAQHPDRNAQFEHINAMAKKSMKRGVPAISVDTMKKELVGNFANGGREWQPEGDPELVDVHDFPGDAVGKAIPYGVYDIGANDGFVSVGVDHDTPVFAVTSIGQHPPYRIRETSAGTHRRTRPTGVASQSRRSHHKDSPISGVLPPTATAPTAALNPRRH